MATNHPISDLPMSPAVDYIPQLLTAADLAEMPSELPSGPVRYELDDGVLVVMTPAGADHCYIEGVIARELGVQGQLKGYGVVFPGEVTIILRRKPDRVVGADVAFVSTARQPVRKSRQGYLETIPDLVVEVVSKNDRRAYLMRKVNDYLRAGVSIVWLVYPTRRTLVEHRAQREPVTYDESATVELPELIPGFQLRLADVFAAP